MSKLTVQQVSTQVRGIATAIVGISRVNPALYKLLKRKCEALEKDLVSCCDKLVDAPEGAIPPEHFSLEERDAACERVEASMNKYFINYLNDDSLSKAEILNLLTPKQPEGDSNVPSSTSENEEKKEEVTSASAGTAAEVGAGGKSIGEKSHVDDDALLAGLPKKAEGSSKASMAAKLSDSPTHASKQSAMAKNMMSKKFK